MASLCACAVLVQMRLLRGVVEALWVELCGFEVIGGVQQTVRRGVVEVVRDTSDGWRHFDVRRVSLPEGAEPHAAVLVRVHHTDGVVNCSCTVFATCIICCHVFSVLFSPVGLGLRELFEESGPKVCASELVSILRGTRWVGESCLASASLNVSGATGADGVGGGAAGVTAAGASGGVVAREAAGGGGVGGAGAGAGGGVAARGAAGGGGAGGGGAGGSGAGGGGAGGGRVVASVGAGASAGVVARGAARGAGARAWGFSGDAAAASNAPAVPSYSQRRRIPSWRVRMSPDVLKEYGLALPPWMSGGN